MIIREVKADDICELKDLLIDIEKYNRRGDSDEAAIKNLQKMVSWNIEKDDHKMFIAEEDNKILGFVGLHFIPYLILHGKPEGYVSELFIKESERGRGIGGLLLEKAAEEAKKAGCLRLQLINFRDRESYKRSFYAKHGWEEREIAADFVYDL